MNLRSKVIRCVVALAALPLLAACVSQERYDELLTAYRDVEQQLLRSQSDLATSRANEERLRSQLALAAADLEQMRGLQGADKEAIERLLADYDRLMRELGNINVGPLPAALNQALADLARQFPDMLQFDERTGMLRFASDFTFDSGSAQLKPGTSAVLARLAQILNSSEARPFEVKVVGHTDNQPINRVRDQHPTNMHLSAHRAISVRDALVRDGVAANRMQVAGYGEFRPVVPNGARGAAANRRVEIFLTPLTVPLADFGSAPAPAAATRTAPAPAPRRVVDDEPVK
ncbi:MAG: OmpA family protein [Phycisphaeraceae bacterium]|nr:OmpA family protein [Phycisphaeraceae bacterium]